MGEFSISHVLILTLVLLIFFGPSRLPALGQSIGKAIKGFKNAMNEVDNEITATHEPKIKSEVPLQNDKNKVEEKSHQDKA